MLDLDMDLTPEETQELIDSLARQIAGRRLEAPAILLLEIHKPLSFIASQGLACALPVLGPIVGPERVARVSRLLRERGNIDLLVARIEELAAQRDLAASKAEEQV
jgi:hypothetical protein